MGCGASNAASSPAGSNPTVDRPAPLEITRPAGDAPTRRGSNAAERAEAAAEAAASPTSGDRTRWQAAAARQQEARDEALAKLQAAAIKDEQIQELREQVRASRKKLFSIENPMLASQHLEQKKHVLAAVCLLRV